MDASPPVVSGTASSDPPLTARVRLGQSSSVLGSVSGDNALTARVRYVVLVDSRYQRFILPFPCLLLSSCRVDASPPAVSGTKLSCLGVVPNPPTVRGAFVRRRDPPLRDPGSTSSFDYVPMDQEVWGSPYADVYGGPDQSVASKTIEATVLASMIASLSGDANQQLAETLAASEAGWLVEAHEFLRCADGPPPTEGLLSISGAGVLADSADVRARGYAAVFRERADQLRFRGAKKAEIASLWAGYPELDKMLHLTEFGQAEFVKEGFVRNGTWASVIIIWPRWQRRVAPLS